MIQVRMDLEQSVRDMVPGRCLNIPAAEERGSGLTALDGTEACVCQSGINAENDHIQVPRSEPIEMSKAKPLSFPWRLKEYLLHHLAEDVAQRNVGLLNPGGIIRGDNEGTVSL